MCRRFNRGSDALVPSPFCQFFYVRGSTIFPFRHLHINMRERATRILTSASPHHAIMKTHALLMFASRCSNTRDPNALTLGFNQYLTNILTLRCGLELKQWLRCSLSFLVVGFRSFRATRLTLFFHLFTAIPRGRFQRSRGPYKLQWWDAVPQNAGVDM